MNGYVRVPLNRIAAGRDVFMSDRVCKDRFSVNQERLKQDQFMNTLESTRRLPPSTVVTSRPEPEP